MDPPAGWRVWNEEVGGQLVLAYRPDVFDAQGFPAACLPTVTVARGRSPDDPTERRTRSSSWYRALFLEPTVRVRSVDARFDTYADAVDGAFALAAAFSAGEIEYRDAYQVPRAAYLDMIDSLVGSGADGCDVEQASR